ncbi:DMT family protein [Pectobacterium brasiliense]|uniref:DMT family protein n=1 Tax=Pectobacterium TaxID=122277 RepID=UPI0022856E6D|nr:MULTISPECIES: DMT family protein [Pectobacterium]
MQVSANRIGSQIAFAGILEILLDAIGLSLFIPFSMFMLKELLRTDYICLPGAVFFLFCVKCSAIRLGDNPAVIPVLRSI